jgi:hypothetical protein
MSALRTLWAPAAWWPVWLGITVGTFLFRELWALVSGRPQDTLSQWIWNHLHIVAGETIGQWTAADFLLFCVYVTVFVLWLPWHFFFHRFT